MAISSLSAAQIGALSVTVIQGLTQTDIKSLSATQVGASNTTGIMVVVLTPGWPRWPPKVTTPLGRLPGAPATSPAGSSRSYKPQPMRTLEEIRADILALEKETEGLLNEIVGSHEETPHGA